MSKFLHSLTHAIAGAAAVGIAAVITGWHPNGGAIGTLVWTAAIVPALSAVVHFLEQESKKP